MENHFLENAGENYDIIYAEFKKSRSLELGPILLYLYIELDSKYCRLSNLLGDSLVFVSSSLNLDARHFAGIKDMPSKHP